MNVQAQMSGQVPSQRPQLPVLSQQNISSLPQMQSLGAISNMDPEMILYRKQMCEKITQIFLKRPGSNAEILPRLPDIVRRLEEGLYRTARTKEDYLNMETLESRLQSLLKGYPKHNQPLTRHISSSSPVSTMIPTPGMSHSHSSTLTVSSSLDNSMIVAGGPGSIESSTSNTGNIAQSSNGLTGAGHGASFTMSDGMLINCYQQSPANMSIGSGGNSMMPGLPCLSSQMMPTPGLNIPKSMPMGSTCTSGGGLSGVDSTIISQEQQQQQQQQQQQLLQQQKHYLGNQSGRVLHAGVQMGLGSRSNVQQRPLHGLSNGVGNSVGLTIIGSSMPLMNGPAASEGFVTANTYSSSPRTLQQHFEQQRHQPIITTSSSQLKIPLSADGYGMNASDVSGAGNTYGSATTGSTLNNQNINLMNMPSKSKVNPLQDQQHLQSTQQISNKSSPFGHSQSVNFQSVHSTQEHFQSQQQTQAYQQPQQFQQQSGKPYGQHIQNQQQNRNQQHQLYMLKNDMVRSTSLISGIGGQVINEHGMDTFNEPLLQHTPEQFHLSGLHSCYQTKASDERHSKVNLGHSSASQDFHPAFLHGSQQMQQILHSNNQGSQSQSEFNHLSAGSQPETLLQNQWQSQILRKSHTVDQLSFDQHIQDFHQRIVGQDEAQQPYFSLEGSIAASAAGATSLTTAQFTSGVGCGPENSLRERQYFNQRRWLLFLHHARWCPSPKGKCQEANCITVQHLLSHMRNCNDDQCGYPRCLPSKTLINHYRSCQARDCPVCVPVHVYVSSQRKAAIRPPNADCPHVANVSWKNVSAAGADGLVIESNCVSSFEASEDLQTSLKRRKVGNSSSLMVKSGSSPASCSLLDPTQPSQNIRAQVQQQKGMPLTFKPDIIDMKTESSLASGLLNPSNFNLVKMDDFEDVYGSRSHSESVLQNEHGGCQNTENMHVNGDTDQFAAEVKQEPNAHTGDSGTGSKSGKPKIKGVSMTELFTPEQIREHIVSLRQWIGQSKAKAEKNQAMERSMNENSCQLCAVEKLTFEPPPIYCSLCGARIKRNASYYTIGTGDTRHYFCIPCYNEARGDSIEVEGTSYLKARLEKKKNDEETEEWWVQCDKCEAWQHQICALFNGRRNDGGQAEYTCPNCYIQEVGSGERAPLPQSAVLGAKDLPRTILSDHIEQRLFRRLKQERQERARHLGKSVDEVPGVEALVVRVVSSVDKKLEVKQKFLEIFQEENYPTEFPYKSKVVLLFQKIEGVEVCLFGMYVQEFGSECQFPNQRRVYLSYLDSVKYFRPEIKTITGEALRTFVYQEILIGYLEYCKKRGFASCYIWACPPLKGEDYILYCHPEIQKTPKSDKLREWYLSMLRKASKENIVVDLTNLYDHFFVKIGECKASVTAARLPYFDGDYWPGAAEDLINQLQQEEDGRNQQKKGKTKKTITKRALKAAGQSDLSGNASKDAILMAKLGETIAPMKEDFIMVHLQHACNHCCLLMVSGIRWVCNQCKNFQLCDKCYEKEQKIEERERHPVNAREKHLLSPVEINDVPLDTKDKDEILESEFFDTRQAFLSLCQGNHYQYDTLRRAKHSSMMVLYHLHNPTAPAFVITCNMCHRDIETGQGWRCEICPDFDVCNDCYQIEGGVNHPHRLTNHPSVADRDAQNKEARQKRVLQLRKMLDLLVHASQCRSLHCQYPNCRKVKGLFRHGINCKTRASGGCVLCKKMWYLLQLHARACKESECHVPRCRDLREHLRRLQQQSDSRRRAAVMEMMRQRAAEVAGNTG